jgi:hypothetical protein
VYITRFKFYFLVTLIYDIGYIPSKALTTTGTLVLKCSFLKYTVVWAMLRMQKDGMKVVISWLV